MTMAEAMRTGRSDGWRSGAPTHPRPAETGARIFFEQEGRHHAVSDERGAAGFGHRPVIRRANGPNRALAVPQGSGLQRHAWRQSGPDARAPEASANGKIGRASNRQ